MKRAVFVAAIVAFVFTACNSDKNRSKLELSGTLEAKYITVSAKTAGEIKSMRFDEGDSVHIGDTLFIIDSEAYRLQLQNAVAAVNLASAQQELLVNGARKEDIAQAEALLNQAQINFDQAKSDKDRFESLLQSHTITQKQYDDVLLRFRVAGEQLNAAKENAQKVKKITRNEELKQAQARLDQARAGVSSIEKSIRDCFIISPMNGIIVKKYFEQGEIVSPMSNIAKLSDLSIMYLWVYVSETDLAKIQIGSAADVKVDGYPNKIFNGKIVFISPESEFTPKNIQTKDERTKLVFGVKIEIMNAGMELKAGLPADAIIPVKD